MAQVVADEATNDATNSSNSTPPDTTVTPDPPVNKHASTALRSMDRHSNQPRIHVQNATRPHSSTKPQLSSTHLNGSSSHSPVLPDALHHPHPTTSDLPPRQPADQTHHSQRLHPNNNTTLHHPLHPIPASKPLSTSQSTTKSEPSTLPSQPDTAPDSSSLDFSRPPHAPQPFNIVSSLNDMSLNPQIDYPSTLQIMPMGPPQIIPIHPQHPAQLPHQHRRHHQPPIIHQPHPHHQQQQTFEHWVPQERVGAVIGGHGTVIRNLQEKSGATIQVHNDTVRDELKLFTIFGTRAQYETAVQLVKEIVERPRPSSHHYTSHHPTSFDARSHQSSSVHSSNHMSTTKSSSTSDMCKTVYVPTSCVGLVIGRNGETIKSLQDRSGADIKVTPDRKATPGSDDRSILISGTEDAIATAHQLVSEIVNDARSRRPSHHGALQPGATFKGQPVITEALAVPNEKVGLIIGKKGITIRELQVKSGAKIQVAKDDSSIRNDGSRPIAITGARSQVEDAKAMIANKINVSMLTIIQPPSTFQSPFVGTHGMTLPPAQPHGMQYVMPPNVYDPEYSNGQIHTFPQVVDLTDPNNSHNRHPMAYVPSYFGFNNVAPMTQHGQYTPQAMQMPFNHGVHTLHQAQQPQSSQQQPLHDQASLQGPQQIQQQPQQQQQQQQQTQQQLQPPEQESQIPASAVVQSQQQVDGVTPPANMVARDANSGFVMFPSHPFHPMASQIQPQHLYPGIPNPRVFPPRESHAHAHAQAQMLAHAQAQAQAQMHSQPYSQLQPMGAAQPNEAAEAGPLLDQQAIETAQNPAPVPSEIEQQNR
ncbi:Far upstream element-binding protein 1 [Gracilariopsis chorda]|uniref:Far upstream element-binding protein 1 n=1 Tax=Gracilariopsis chorda TaxID=448386 RepID=A0A2V3ITH5_9FLOR|nr:Far upstream element-binding protein 1 [Gracilariopsis chorda]|eukprot:PXF45426.1 Far upstream element-binding protein 1 [Gracilariopsis chorda]